MFKHLYYRFLLAILPSVEDHLNSVERLIKRIEDRTSHIENAIEEEVVHLANSAKARREAIAAIDATYDHKNDISAKVIAAYREEAAKANAAREAVAHLLGL